MKEWYESKMVWFNIIMTVVELVAFVGTLPGLPSEVLPYLATIQGVGNVVLRVWFTELGIRS